MLLGIATAMLVLVVMLVSVRPGAHGKPGRVVGRVTFVAASGAVAAGFAARGDADVAHALELVAIAARSSPPSRR